MANRFIGGTLPYVPGVPTTWYQPFDPVVIPGDPDPFTPGIITDPGDPSQWDPWITIPGTGGIGGVGICPPGMSCLGVSPLGVCIGGCVPGVIGDGDERAIGPPLEDRPPVTAKPGAFAPVNGCCPSGYHLNKSAYWRMENGQHVYIMPQTRCVRNRRRNPLNPRAADRAIGRLRSASAFGKYLAKVTLPPKGTKKR